MFDIAKRNVMVNELVNDKTITRTAGRVRSHGVEFDVARQLTDSLSAIATYAYTDARVAEHPDYKDNQMADVARNSASLFLTQALGPPGWHGGNLRVAVGEPRQFVLRASVDF